MNNILILLVFVFFGSISNVFGQTESLWSDWKKESNPDSVKLQALYDIIWNDYLFVNQDSAIHYANIMDSYALKNSNKKYQALSYKLKGICFTINGKHDKAIESYQKGLIVFKEIKDSSGIANTYNNIGLLYRNIGEYYKALDNYKLSFEIEKKRENKADMADVLGNIGTVYQFQGIYPLALEQHQKSLHFRTEIDDKNGMAKSINNIGNIYFESGDFDLAIINYNESLAIFEELEDSKGMSTCYNNIGNIYHVQEQLDLSLQYYEKCLDIYAENANKSGEAAAFLNIGLVYRDKKNYQAALENLKKSLVIRFIIDDKKGIAMTQHNLARVYMILNQLDDASENGRSSLELAKKIGSLYDIKESASILYEVEKKQKDYKQALAMFELFTFTRDSMFNEENTEKIIQQQYKFEYDKKTAADSVILGEKMKVKNAEIAASNAETEKQRLEAASQKKQNLLLYGGLGLVALFGIFIFNRYKVTQRQKNVIDQQKLAVESQKQKLEETHKEITDSILYAKRIQAAILPSDKIVKEYLKDSFVIYKPKDIVAGDFYWMEQKGDSILFAAADCTGHGVPGAMVSVVCNNALNRSVREFGLNDPGEILNKTREIVIQEFEKSEEDVKDGMDISLCYLKGTSLTWAGANNPLWIIRNGEVIEYKGDKQPIGKFARTQPFTSHKIQLEKGDCIYIFSDGFADQFGGPKGKKFMSSKFKKLLIANQHETMAKQKQIIDRTFEDWRSDQEQLDDVCVIGVRI